MKRPGCQSDQRWLAAFRHDCRALRIPKLPLPARMHRLRCLLSDESGSNLVEFAISAMILFLVIFGILDCSRAIYAHHYVSYTAAEAARYAMVRGSTWNNTPCTNTASASCTATTSDVSKLVQSITPVGIDTINHLNVVTSWTGLTPSGASCNAKGIVDSPGCVVQVQVTYNFNFVLPFLPSNGLQLKGSSATVVIQ